MKGLGRLDDYSWDKPVRVPSRINVTSYNGVNAILDNGEAFGVAPWRRGFYYLMGNPG
jgi:prostaglandin-endoperoxide synthase 2/linoleate 10R-lipoxygenase